MKTTKLSAKSSVFGAVAMAVASAGLVAADSAGGSAVLEEIVVTAQKRVQSLQDVPISLTVLTGERIASNHITDLGEMSQYIPNLQTREGTEGAEIVLRGVGNSGGTNFGFQSPVGIFLDGIYHGRLNQGRIAYYDVERIEVMRGPQSTLFGMNTIVGAISVVSRRPTADPELQFGVLYDPEYNNTELTGVLSGPLSDTLNARFATRITQEDGYVYNTLFNKPHGGVDDQSARLTLAWNPSDALSVTTRIDYGKRFADGYNWRALTAPTTATDLSRMLAIDPRAEFSFKSLNTSQDQHDQRISSLDASVTVDYDFNGHTLTSITGYSKFAKNDFNGFSVTPVSVGQIRGEEDYEQYSQELRIASPTSGRLEYIAGLYYQTSDQAYLRPADFILGNFIPALAALPSAGLQTFAQDFFQDFKTYAIFGQATFKMTDSFRVTAGARYYKEDQDARSFLDWLVPGTTGQANALKKGTPAYANADFVFNTLFGNVAHTNKGSASDDGFLPEVKLQWDPSSQAMFYASYGKGKKSGGFNDRDSRNINWQFGPEKSTNYEVGTKLTLLDGSALLNMSLFQTKFENMQLSYFSLPQLLFIVENAAKATSQGIEADAVWRLSRGFAVNVSAAWLQKAKFDEFRSRCVPAATVPTCIATPASPTGGFQNNSGFDLNAPKTTASVGLEWNGQLNSSMSLNGRLDANYRSGSQDRLNNALPVESVTFVNGRVGLKMDNGWSIGLVGRNLTDKRHVGGWTGSLWPGMYLGSVSDPRNFSIEVTYRP